jgi:ribosomal protein L23
MYNNNKDIIGAKVSMIFSINVSDINLILVSDKIITVKPIKNVQTFMLL